MKKATCILLLFVFIKSFCSAQEVWKMNPIQVNQLALPSGDRYFKYSCYDSILAVTVVDSTPAYSYFLAYNINYGLLAYYHSFGSYLYIVFYDVNNHTFSRDSVLRPWGNYCTGNINILGNYAQFYTCGPGGLPESETFIYADILHSNMYGAGFSYYDQFGFSVYSSNGWFIDFEGGVPAVPIPDIRNFTLSQPGMFGYSGAVSGNNNSVDVVDGILRLGEYDEPRMTYYSNDSCGVIGYDSLVIANLKNGLGYISDSMQMHLVSDDAWVNQWVVKNLPYPYVSGKSNAILSGRVIAFAVNKDTTANVFCAAYNTITHQWVVDSLQSNGVNNLAITQGTVSWTDTLGVQFTRGYADSIGWGNFNTPLKIDFYLENYQSPTNGNLVYVRNYTIGTDNTLIDFGDGTTTNLKSQSHLFKNANGTYRTSSSINYNVCVYALGQSNCKPVSFIVDTKNLEEEKKTVNIRYAKEKGVFIIDNKSNKKLKVEVYNLTGQIVKIFNCENAFQTFNLTQSSYGIYLVRLAAKDGSFQKSFKLVN